MKIVSGAGAYRTPEPGKRSDYAEHLRVPDMSIGTYSIPARGHDGQTPHGEDEIYIVTKGRARFLSDTGETAVGPGDVIYVPAGEEHRFVEVTEDLAMIVVFAPAETDTD